MPHALELKYGLTAQELLEAIDKRFRLKVALEGAVAEVHFERKLRIASREGWLTSYESHDRDGMHDFTVVTLSGISVITSMLWLFVSVAPLAIGVNSDTH